MFTLKRNFNIRRFKYPYSGKFQSIYPKKVTFSDITIPNIKSITILNVSKSNIINTKFIPSVIVVWNKICNEFQQNLIIPAICKTFNIYPFHLSLKNNRHITIGKYTKTYGNIFDNEEDLNATLVRNWMMWIENIDIVAKTITDTLSKPEKKDIFFTVCKTLTESKSSNNGKHTKSQQG